MKKSRILLAAVGAVLYSLAVPNEFFADGNIVLALVCLACYFAAVAAAKDNREAVRLGIVFGALSTALSNYWLIFFGDFSLWTLGGATLGYSIYHMLLAVILRRTWQNPAAWRSIAVAAVWVGYEYFKSVGFLAYPWGLISYPAATSLTLIQHVDVTGVWALSFLFAAVNALVAERIIGLVSNRTPGSEPNPTSTPAGAGQLVRQGLWLGIILAIMLGYGVHRLNRPIPQVDEIRLVLVQQNINAWQRGREEDALRAAQQLSREAVDKSERPVDLVVWSETSLRRPYPQNTDFYSSTPVELPLTRFIRELDIPLLTGAPYLADSDTWEIYNSAILIDTNAELVQHYGKQHLVPFAESIPFWNLNPVRSFFQEVIGLYGVWTVGPEYRLFEMPQKPGQTRTPITFGTPICFEDAFAYLVRGFVLSGADLLINLTDNSWSATDSAQFQHYVAARFRPIETRRTLVRSTNSGLTTVLDAHGRTIASLPMFEQATLTIDVPVYREKHFTIYTWWGDYLPHLFLFFWIVLVFHQAKRDGYLSHPKNVTGNGEESEVRSGIEQSSP